MGKNKREMSGNVLNYFYALGEAVVGLFAWLYGDWVTIQLLVSAPPLIFVLYYWFVPESVRWLLIKEKNEKANKIIRKAARVNGVELSERLLASFDPVPKVVSIIEFNYRNQLQINNRLFLFKVPVHPSNDQKAEPLTSTAENNRGNMMHAFKLALKSRPLIIRFLIIVYNWITNAFVYYGLSLNSTSLSGNKYLNYTLVCLIEIPGYTISWVSVPNYEL